MTSQVHRSAAAGVRRRGLVQPRVCLRNRSVLKIETPQEHLPQPIHGPGVDPGAGEPQPQRFRFAVTGEPVDLQPDHGAFEDRQGPRMVGPDTAVGQQRVQPIEGPGHRVPYRLVSVVVLWAGSGQVRGSLSFNTGP